MHRLTVLAAGLLAAAVHSVTFAQTPRAASPFAETFTGLKARSLGPAVMSRHFEHLWIYLLAPVIGACVGVLGCHCVRESGCCSGRTLRQHQLNQS